MKAPREDDILPRSTYRFAAWGIPGLLFGFIGVRNSNDLGVLLVALVLASIAFDLYRRERVVRFVVAIRQVHKMSALGALRQAEAALDMIDRKGPPRSVRPWTSLERAAIAFRRGQLDKALSHAKAILDSSEPWFGRGATTYPRALAKAGLAVTLALLGEVDQATALADEVRADVSRKAFDDLGAYGGAVAPVLVAYADVAQALVLHRQRRQGDLTDLLARRGEAMRRASAREYRVLVRALSQSTRQASGAGPYRASRGEPLDISTEPADANDWLERVAPTLPSIPSNAPKGARGVGPRNAEPQLAFKGKRDFAARAIAFAWWMWRLSVALVAGGIGSIALHGKLEPRPFALAVFGVLAVWLTIRLNGVRRQRRLGKAVREAFDGAPDAKTRLDERAKWGPAVEKASAATFLAQQSYDEGDVDAAIRWATIGLANTRTRSRTRALASIRATAHAALGDEKRARADLARVPARSADGQATMFSVEILLAIHGGNVAKARNLALAFPERLPVALETELLGAVAIAVSAPSEVSRAERDRLREELGPNTGARRFFSKVAPKLLTELDAILGTLES